MRSGAESGVECRDERQGAVGEGGNVQIRS